MNIKDKRGFELTITTLILIILGLLVLGVLIYGFSSGWNVFWNKITGYSGGKDNVQSVINACGISCTSDNNYDYCSLKRKVVKDGNEETATCRELETTYDLKCDDIICS